MAPPQGVFATTKAGRASVCGEGAEAGKWKTGMVKT